MNLVSAASSLSLGNTAAAVSVVSPPAPVNSDASMQLPNAVPRGDATERTRSMAVASTPSHDELVAPPPLTWMVEPVAGNFIAAVSRICERLEHGAAFLFNGWLAEHAFWPNEPETSLCLTDAVPYRQGEEVAVCARGRPRRNPIQGTECLRRAARREPIFAYLSTAGPNPGTDNIQRYGTVSSSGSDGPGQIGKRPEQTSEGAQIQHVLVAASHARRECCRQAIGRPVADVDALP